MKSKIEPQEEDKFLLYVLPGFFICAAIFFIIKLSFEITGFLLAAPFLILAAGFHFLSKENLKFLELDATATEANFNKCVQTVKKHEWKILQCHEYQEIIAETQFSWRSWGEVVTIIFEDNKIYINSRPSPNKKSSLVTWGKNTINVNIIRRALE